MNQPPPLPPLPEAWQPPTSSHQTGAAPGGPGLAGPPGPLDSAGSAPAGPVPAFDDGQWQHLPRRGAKLAAFGGAIGFAIPAGLALGAAALFSGLASPWLVAPLAALAGAGFGAWLELKRHYRTLWKLDSDGFGLQRGRWWRTESRVPISRVQHLDLKRGPIERSLHLATLVIHTAGTRMATVSVSGLDDADAERLRDRLARQLDHDDDAL